MSKYQAGFLKIAGYSGLGCPIALTSPGL